MNSYPIWRDVGVNYIDVASWPESAKKICVDDPATGKKKYEYACELTAWFGFGEGWTLKSLELFE